mmetsp:Transcript_10278/g.18111  ORF Transcript_10278/g.18111 Transcript_10278/m.18111 type:complete len:770 (+) Transcript_10278:31-2340(+)
MGRDVFVFAGCVYERPTPPPLSSRLHEILPRTLNRLVATVRGGFQQDQSSRDGTALGAATIAVACAGAIAAALLAVELLPLLVVKSSKSSVPKINPGAFEDGQRRDGTASQTSAQAATQPEGAKSKSALTSKLKSLKAAMSAERAGSSGDSKSSLGVLASGKASDSAPSSAPMVASNSTGLPALYQNLQGTVKYLKEETSIASCYKIQETLSSIDMVLLPLVSSAGASQRDMDVEMKAEERLRELGRELATVAAVASSRTDFPPRVRDGLCALHENLLRIHELALENVHVPAIASQLQQALTEAARQAPEADDLEQALDIIQSVQEAPPAQMLHRLVSLSVLVNSIQEDCGPSVEDARSSLERLAEIADHLVATKAILRVVRSLREISGVVEGYSLTNRLWATRLAATKLWPETMRCMHPGYDMSGVGLVSPLKLLIEMHLLVRREQYFRGFRTKASIHDLALWKHLVNACDEVSSLAFSTPEEPQFSKFAVSFLEAINNLLSCLAGRRTRTLTGECIAPGALMQRAEFSVAEVKFVNPETAKVIAALVSDESHIELIRAVYLHVSQAVEAVVPGASVGVMVSQGSTVRGCSDPDGDDVIMCLSDALEAQLFVRKSLSEASYTALVEDMTNISLSGVLQQFADSTPTAQQQETIECFGNALEQLTRFSMHTVTELPGSTRRAIERKQYKGVHELLQAQHSISKASLSEVVDSLSLREDPASRGAAPPSMTLASADPTAMVLVLLPDVIVVFAKARSLASNITSTLSNVA